MSRNFAAAMIAVTMLAGAAQPAVAAKVPDTWDGLIRVKSKRLSAVYLLPNADFRAYTKVMIDPTQVAFRKDWQRDYNSSTVGLSRRIDDKEAQKIADLARTGFGDIFVKAYQKAGYQVVTTPAPDVLRLSTAVINLAVDAPDQMTAGMVRTYSADAGEATVAIEARDSTTGAILGRAVDRRYAGDSGPYRRSSVSNRADFARLFEDWAKASANGLATLKSLSPIDTNGALARK